MIKLHVSLVFILFCITLQAQQWEAPSRFPSLGEKPGLKEIDFPIMPFNKNNSGFTTTVKNTSNCIDTLYNVRFSNVFMDVNDWDSSYFISGYTHNERHYAWDSVNPALLTTIKLDYSGQVLWKRTDSVMSGDHVTTRKASIIRLTDGDFLQVGVVFNDYIHPRNYDWRAAVYTKFNTNGNTIWQKVYKDTAYLKCGDWPMDVIPEDDGGFTVAALVASDSKTYSPDTNINYWYTDTTYIGLIRYDSLGNIEKRKLHFIGGDPINRTIGFIKKQSDGGYLVGGINAFNGPNLPCSYYLLKVDSNFNWQWRKLFSQTTVGGALMEIIPFSNDMNRFAVIRSDTPIETDAYGNTYYTGYYQMGTMDSLYNIISDTIFNMFLTNPPDPFYYDAGLIVGAVVPLNNNGIIACSYVGYGANIVSLDNDNKFRWNRWIANFPYFTEEPYKMRRAHDGGFLIVGYCRRAGMGGWFVKTDTNGFALPNCADTLYHIGLEEYYNASNSITIKTYPNPTKDFINIEFDKTLTGENEISIIDITGRTIVKETFSGQKIIRINLSSITKGIYIVKVITNDKQMTSCKLLKL
jgi:hypothetical protein